MFYYLEVTTPANTPASAPLRTVLKVTSGMAREEWFMFPDGPYGLAHIQVWHHGWQVWPWDPQQSLHWNNYVFHVQDRYPFTAAPFELVLKTWNLDDSYAHNITFALTVDPLPPPTEMAGLTDLLAELGLT